MLILTFTLHDHYIKSERIQVNENPYSHRFYPVEVKMLPRCQMKDITHFIIEDEAKARPTGDLQNFHSVRAIYYKKKVIHKPVK